MKHPRLSSRRLVVAALLLIIGTPCLPASAPERPDLECKVERSRKMRVEGGDHDDKTERVSFDIKLTNRNWKKAVTELTGTFYVFGESVHDRKAYKLVQKETFGIDIDARGTFETSTPIAEMKYDTTFASFGEKYRGWVLVLQNGDGDTVYENASSVFMKDSEPLATLDVGDYCNRDGKKISEPKRPW